MQGNLVDCEYPPELVKIPCYDSQKMCHDVISSSAMGRRSNGAALMATPAIAHSRSPVLLDQLDLVRRQPVERVDPLVDLRLQRVDLYVRAKSPLPMPSSAILSWRTAVYALSTSV